MSKVFAIPDIHLKPWIFDKAEECISKGSYDKIVFLGDLIDDWGQENNEALYKLLTSENSLTLVSGMNSTGSLSSLSI